MDADEWGREVESRISTAQNERLAVSGTLSNVERSTSGQLAATEIQVGELLNQVTQTLSPAGFSVTGSLNTEPYNRDSITITFPPVPGNRSAFLSIGAVIHNSVATLSSSVVIVRYLDTVIMRQTPLPSGNSLSDPVESQGNGIFSDFARIQTFSDTPVSVVLEVVRRGSAESTVTVSNIRASLSRSGS